MDPSGRINYKRLKKLLQAELDSSYESVEAAQLHFLRVFGEEIRRVSSFGASDPGAEALLDKGAKTDEGPMLAEWRNANREACRKILKKHRKKAGRGGDEEAARPSLDYDEILETAYSKLEQAHQECLETHLRSRVEAAKMMRVIGGLSFAAGLAIVLVATVANPTGARTVLAFGVLFGALLAWSNGANDAANSMGTAVGAGSISLAKGVLLGAAAELAGAALLGVHVSKTISKGVIQTEEYEEEPLTFAFAMAAVLAGASITTTAATYYKLPISATHGIVGGLIGVGALAKGTGSLGQAAIVRTCLSWVLSPSLGGAVAWLIQLVIHIAIFRTGDPGKNSQRFQPYFGALAGFIICSFFLLKGPKAIHFWPAGTYAVPFLTALGVAAATGAAIASYRGLGRPQVAEGRGAGGSGPGAGETFDAVGAKELVGLKKNPTFKERLEEMEEAEQVEGRKELEREKPFNFLLVITSACVAFAHGANDVVNSAGPFAAILEGASDRVAAKPDVPFWVVLLGGGLMSIGILTWGERTISTVSTKITALSPSKAFAVQLGAAVAVLTASVLELPVSTSHCLVGSVIGASLAERVFDGSKTVDFKVLGRILVSWLITIPLAMAIACAFYAVADAAYLRLVVP